MADSNRIVQIKQYMELTHAPTPWFWQWDFLLSDYDARKARGESKATIVNAWKRLGYDATMAAAFVNASAMLDANVPIQDPNERPSWSEAYDMGLGQLEIPWGKVFLGALVVTAVWGFSTRAGAAAPGAFRRREEIPRP